jgi:hypothetical protein
MGRREKYGESREKNTSRKDKNAERIRGKPKEGYGAGKAGRRGKS